MTKSNEAKAVEAAQAVIAKHGNQGFSSAEFYNLAANTVKPEDMPSRYRDFGFLGKSDLFRMKMVASKPHYFLKDAADIPKTETPAVKVERRPTKIEQEIFNEEAGGLKVPDLFNVSEELKETLRFSFNALNRRIKAVTKGIFKGLLISGGAGTGKTFGVTKYLTENVDPQLFYHLRGRVSPIMAYLIMYEYRHKGCVVLIDDADGIMAEDVGLNIIKAATEVDGKRTISWQTDRKMPDVRTPDEDDDGNPKIDPETGEVKMIWKEAPKTFKFEGAVIMISNINFEDMKKGKLEEHVRAVTSRCETVNMGCYDLESRFARIVQIVEDVNPLQAMGFADNEANEIMEFIATHKHSLKDVDLRTLTKVGNIYEMYREEDGAINPDWRKDAIWSLCHKEGDKRK